MTSIITKKKPSVSFLILTSEILQKILGQYGRTPFTTSVSLSVHMVPNSCIA